MEDQEHDDRFHYLSSITSLLGILDKYNKRELINDFLHIQNGHYLHRNEVKQYIHTLLPDQCTFDENEEEPVSCQYTHRLAQNREVYRFTDDDEHDDLDIIELNELYHLNHNGFKHGSLDEMGEINLQNYLDLIHGNLLHDVTSNGDKFITKIPGDYLGGNEDCRLDKHGIVDLGDGGYEFGVFFNYWSQHNDHYCSPKYDDLKDELLRNGVYRISENDYILVQRQAVDFVHCEYGKQLTVKRLFPWMKTRKLKIGDRITTKHVVALLTCVKLIGKLCVMDGVCHGDKCYILRLVSL